MTIGLDKIETRAFALAERLRAGLADIPGATLRDLGHRAGVDRCAIVSFTIDGLEPASAVTTLRERGVSIGASTQDGALLDATARHLPVLLRAAPHYYNTEDEIDLLIRELKALKG